MRLTRPGAEAPWRGRRPNRLVKPAIARSIGAFIMSRMLRTMSPMRLPAIAHLVLIVIVLTRNCGGQSTQPSSPTVLSGWQAIHDAAWNGDADMVRRLLATGADPNALIKAESEADFDQATPLMLAAQRG